MLPPRGTALGFLFFAWDSVSKSSAATARALVGGVVGLLVLNLAVNIGFNHWHRWFFDMLEQREAGKLFGAIVALFGLIVSGAAFAVSMMWCRMTLQLELRRVVTIKLIDMWIARSRTDSSTLPTKTTEALHFALQRMSVWHLIQSSI